VCLSEETLDPVVYCGCRLPAVCLSVQRLIGL
jgi:hypothetical protein